MTDHDALVAAICAEPDEDTPRLVYADFLEENGAAERAAFIRAQIELARTPEWEPFAVYCEWRRPEWITGKPFRDSLPAVDGNGVEWNEKPFRRGLGWHLNVRSLLAWEECEARVLAGAPIGAMHLWSASTLDQWRAFAESPVVPRLREVHFVTSPIEPLRVLREAPAACGITDVFFERSSSPGMMFVVDDLLDSPLGEKVRGLHFDVGYEALDELVESIARASFLERLSLTTMGATPEHVSLSIRHSHRLTHLDLRANPFGSADLSFLLNSLPASLQSLGLSACNLDTRYLGQYYHHSGLRSLDLSANRLTPRAARELSRSVSLAGLRSLNLASCRLEDRGLRWMTRARFWPNLVELSLEANAIPAAGIRHLLDAAVPADLTALVLTESLVATDLRAELKLKYGERVVFVA